jgi:hypothetical protein
MVVIWMEIVSHRREIKLLCLPICVVHIKMDKPHDLCESLLTKVQHYRLFAIFYFLNETDVDLTGLIEIKWINLLQHGRVCGSPIIKYEIELVRNRLGTILLLYRDIRTWNSVDRNLKVKQLFQLEPSYFFDLRIFHLYLVYTQVQVPLVEIWSFFDDHIAVFYSYGHIHGWAFLVEVAYGSRMAWV